MAKVIAPVKGFKGTVVGVEFTDGAGETKDEAALQYFERQGYEVSRGKAKAEPKDTTDADK